MDTQKERDRDRERTPVVTRSAKLTSPSPHHPPPYPTPPHPTPPSPRTPPHHSGFAGVAIAIGKEVKDLLDNKDPVSGQLQWPSGLQVTFELNGKKVPQSGYDENCQLRNYELHRGEGEFAMHISNPGNTSKDIFITNRVLAEGHVLGNGTFVATMCDRRTRNNLFTMSSDSTVSDDASLKSFFDFGTDSRNTFATETPTLTKNSLYDTISITELEIDNACHKLPSSSRRLAMENSHG